MGDPGPSPQVFVATFDDDARAARTDRDLAGLEEQGLIVLLATAVVSRDGAGVVHGSARGDGVRHLSARADIIATMLGVMLSAPVIAAGLVAASDDGPGDEKAEREYSEGFAREVGASLEPGRSVFVGVVEDRWLTELERGLRGYRRLTRERS